MRIGTTATQQQNGSGNLKSDINWHTIYFCIYVLKTVRKKKQLMVLCYAFQIEECVVCSDKKASVLFQPCGHMCACDGKLLK